MKKALVMLLAFALVGGLFAQPTADLAPVLDSFSATLSWGITLGADAVNFISGFKNEISGAVKMPLVKKETVSKGGEGTYGFIEVKEFQLGANLADEIGGSNGTITAKLVFNTALEIAVYNKPDIKISHIVAFKTGDVIEDPTNDTYGTTIKYSTGGQAFGLNATSGQDWTGTGAGADGQKYALGAFANLAFAPVKVNVDIGADFDAAEKLGFGLDAPIAIAGVMKGLEIKPALDATYVVAAGAVDPFLLDAGAGVTLTLSDTIDDKKASAFAGVYYSTADEDVEVKVSFDEPLDNGMVKNFEGGVSFIIWDLINVTPINWENVDYLGYKAIINEQNNFYGRVDFTITNSTVVGSQILKLKLVFTNTAITNTTITATYESGDFIVATGADPDLGKFVLAAKVAY